MRHSRSMYGNHGEAVLSIVAQSEFPQSLLQYKFGGAYEISLESPALGSPQYTPFYFSALESPSSPSRTEFKPTPPSDISSPPTDPIIVSSSLDVILVRQLLNFLHNFPCTCVMSATTKTVYMFRSFSFNMTNEMIYMYVNLKRNSATPRAAGR